MNSKPRNSKPPKGWSDYSIMGTTVKGTKFLPFKAPLRPYLCRNMADDEKFTPEVLINTVAELKLVIDLTNTDKYYDGHEAFICNGIEYRKIALMGKGTLPANRLVRQFHHIVDDFRRNKCGIIGVHCTHGLNRTGYMICRYMVDRLRIHPARAIERFEAARGHRMERKSYVDTLMRIY